MRLTKVLALIAMVALTVPLANAADAKHKFSFGVGYVMPTSDYSETIPDFGSITVEADDAMGYGIAYEHYRSPALSFAASLWLLDHDVTETTPDEITTVAEETIGSVSWMPILFDVNYHFLRDMNLDFYAGATLGYAMWDGIDVSGEGTIETKDTFVYGLNLGLDIPLGENWAITAGLRYLFAEAETDEGEDDITVGVDPIMIGVGIGYKF